MSSTRGAKMADPSYEDVLQFVQENSRPFVTSSDVAEEFDSVSDRTIRKRLNRLVDREELNHRKVGAHAKVWYVDNQSSEFAKKDSPSSLSQ